MATPPPLDIGVECALRSTGVSIKLNIEPNFFISPVMPSAIKNTPKNIITST